MTRRSEGEAFGRELRTVAVTDVGLADACEWPMKEKNDQASTILISYRCNSKARRNVLFSSSRMSRVKANSREDLQRAKRLSRFSF